MVLFNSHLHGNHIRDLEWLHINSTYIQDLTKILITHLLPLIQHKLSEECYDHVHMRTQRDGINMEYQLRSGSSGSALTTIITWPCPHPIQPFIKLLYLDAQSQYTWFTMYYIDRLLSQHLLKKNNYQLELYFNYLLYYADSAVLEGNNVVVGPLNIFPGVMGQESQYLSLKLYFYFKDFGMF